MSENSETTFRQESETEYVQGLRSSDVKGNNIDMPTNDDTGTIEYSHWKP